MIGELLLNAGADVRYDNRHDLVDGGYLTPDWTCEYEGSTFICDVFTAGLLDQRAEYDQVTNDLVGRLSGIKAPFTVIVRVPSEAAPIPDAKALVTHFAKWIACPDGDAWQEGNVTIQIVGPSQDQLMVVAEDPLHVVPTPTSIRETIREKAKKYAVLNAPFVVAAVKHHSAEANAIMFEEAFLGDRVYKSVELSDGRIVGGPCIESNGAIQARPGLSAGIWINPYTATSDRSFKVIENPYADLHLPPRLLDSLKTQRHQRRK